MLNGIAAPTGSSARPANARVNLLPLAGHYANRGTIPHLRVGKRVVFSQQPLLA